MSFLNTFLPIYIGVFGVLFGLGMTTLQRTQDKYNDITTTRIISYIGGKSLLCYIIIFILFTFTVFIFSDVGDIAYKEDIINYDFYFLVSFFILTLIFILLAKDFFYASTAQGILKIYSDSLISRLKKGSTRDFYKFGDRDFTESYKKTQAREWRRSIYTTYLFKGGNFFLGRPLNLPIGYFKGDTVKVLKLETQVLFRIGLRSIEERNTITLRYCLENIQDIFSAYIKYGEEYHGADDYSIFLKQEFDSLFNMALKHDFQPETLEIIAKSLGELVVVASAVKTKNFSGHSETDIFEEQLIKFAGKSWKKEDSGATSLSLHALKNIADSNIENDKIQPTFNTLSHLLEFGKIVATLDTEWSNSITRTILHYSTQIYYNLLIKTLYGDKYPELERVYKNDFYKDITTILETLHSTGKKRGYHHRFSDVFYSDLFNGNLIDRQNKNKHRPIYDYFNQIIFGYRFGPKRYGGVPSVKEKRKEFYKEIKQVLSMAGKIFPISLVDYTQMRDMSGFFYSMVDDIQSLCIFEDEPELRIILVDCLNNNIPILYDHIAKFESFDEEGGTNMFVLIIFLFHLHKKTLLDKNLIEEVISKILNVFSALDDLQDYHKHKRKYIYKYLFFISAWTNKFYHGTDLHKNLEEFILGNTIFKDKYSSHDFWGHSDGEKFEIYNYPESGVERLLRNPDTRIWNSPLSCFTKLDTILEESEYLDYCVYLNNKLGLE